MKKVFTSLQNTLKLALIGLFIIEFSSCATILIPKRQMVDIKVNNDSTSIYLKGEEQGIGKAKTKLIKGDAYSVILKTEGYPTQYETVVGNNYSYWALPIIILDIGLYGWGLLEFFMPKLYAYPKYNYFKILPKLAKRIDSEKYINIDAVKLNIKNKNEDFIDYSIKHTTDIEAEMDKAEKERINSDKKLEAKKKNGKKKQLNDDKLSVTNDDTRFSEAVYKTLTKAGYIDTINQVFLDNNNTLGLEAVISKSAIFNVESKYYKSRLLITWYIKNTFGEKIDSVVNWTSSGAFFIGQNSLMFDDAVNKSLQIFLNSDKTKSYLKIDTNYKILDAPLVINKPKNIVANADDATLASVIIKRKDNGHGSGFAVSNDGYILTNYHVIAGEYNTQPTQFSVVLSNGAEVKATVVRFNKMRDVALLKVDVPFEKAFHLSNEKNFKRLMEVYAVGTPKSIELGQSVSLGILSNERKLNNNNLLQLSMSVNAGNSGGPLFDKQGNLHGIVTSKLVGFSTEGVSFAIPAYAVATYLNLK